MSPLIAFNSYSRFSTPEQVTESKRRQSALAVKWASERGLTIDDSLSMQDYGVSAFIGANGSDTGALGAFLEAIKSGKRKQEVEVS